MGSAMGSSINISTNAGAQLAADLGKGVIQGASQYLSTKFRLSLIHIYTFYEFVKTDYRKILEEKGVREKDFDLAGFLNVLEPYYLSLIHICNPISGTNGIPCKP